jgi:dual specificity phosphatase 3
MEKESDAAFLRDGGVTHVINGMRENTEEKWVLGVGMSYLHVPVEDDGKPKAVEWFKTAIEWALPILACPRNKLYVHCRGGNQRGPSLAYAILRATGLKPSDAEYVIRKRRPQVGLRYKKDADQAIKELKYE